MNKNIKSDVYIKNVLQEDKKSLNLIDLGIGANCIFSLLGAKAFGWKCLGFEKNIKSIEIANKIISENNLNDNIKIINNETFEDFVFDFFYENNIYNKLFEEEKKTIYDFLVCNPPFYLNHFDFKKRKKKGFTAKPHEIICDGGEISFSLKLIKESEKLKNKIKFFCLFLSEKSSMFRLKKEIAKLESKNEIFTEIIPLGKNSRYILIWNFKI